MLGALPVHSYGTLYKGASKYLWTNGIKRQGTISMNIFEAPLYILTFHRRGYVQKDMYNLIIQLFVLLALAVSFIRVGGFLSCSSLYQYPSQYSVHRKHIICIE